MPDCCKYLHSSFIVDSILALGIDLELRNSSQHLLQNKLSDCLQMLQNEFLSPRLGSQITEPDLVSWSTRLTYQRNLLCFGKTSLAFSSNGNYPIDNQCTTVQGSKEGPGNIATRQSDTCCCS